LTTPVHAGRLHDGVSALAQDVEVRLDETALVVISGAGARDCVC
jgi:hypothetical protein